MPLFNMLQNFAPRWRKLALAKFYTTFLGKVICAPTLDTLELVDDQWGILSVPYTVPETLAPCRKVSSSIIHRVGQPHDLCVQLHLWG